jgi:hypothetical protein
VLMPANNISFTASATLSVFKQAWSASLRRRRSIDRRGGGAAEQHDSGESADGPAGSFREEGPDEVVRLQDPCGGGHEPRSDRAGCGNACER